MSGYSIEHSLVFNTAKRILKFIAPEIRVIARDDMSGNESRLNLKTKMLEVPEGQPFRAAGMIIFNAGLMALRSEDRFPTVFGKIPRMLSDQEVVALVAKEHAEADEEAYQWSMKTMQDYFPELDQAQANSLVDHRVTERDWVRYFSS